MKQHLWVFISLLFIIQNNAVAQWDWQNPLPQGNSLYSIQFVNPTTGFALGDGGTILKTIDGGQTWSRHQVGTDLNFKFIFFVDYTNGYAVGALREGGGFVCKTTNGGETWNVLPTAFPENLFAACFTDNFTGIVGGWYVMYKTTDGGLTWFSVNRPPDSYNSIIFTDNQTGYCCGQWAIYKTTNGGNYWDTIYTQQHYLNSLSFPSHDTGFAVGQQGKIIKTIDGGLSWQQQSSGCSNILYSVKFLNNNSGIAVGDSGVILQTVDGGNNWTHIYTPANFRYNSVDFYNASSVGITVGMQGTIVRTSNNGLDWQAISSNTTTNFLYDIRFINQQTGYCVGDKGTIIRTVNSGNTWFPLMSGSSATLHSIVFTDPLTGYTCGKNSTILKTVDSGQSWSPLNPGIQADFQCLQFLSANMGYAFGSGSELIKTQNGGSSWSLLSSSFPIHSMSFISPDTGYFCGGMGQIWKTNDGGNVFIQLPSGTTYKMESIYFINKTTGFVSAYYSTMGFTSCIILKTTDGGSNWIIKYDGQVVANSSKAFCFTNFSTGYLLGYLSFLKTIDGGETWTEYPIGETNYQLKGISFTNPDIGFIAGFGGTILKTTSGGVVTGVEPKQNEDNMVIYPNPSDGRFFIETEQRSMLEIYSLVGQKIYQKVLMENHGKILIDISGCKKGIYLVRLIQDQRQIVKKVILD